MRLKESQISEGLSGQDSSRDREEMEIEKWQNRRIGSLSGSHHSIVRGPFGHRSLRRDARSKTSHRLIDQTSVGCVHGRRYMRIGIGGVFGRYAVHPLPGIVEFRSAIPADLVGPPANGEQAAEVVVATAE